MNRFAVLVVFLVLVGSAGLSPGQDLPEDLPPPRDAEQVDAHAEAPHAIPPPTEADPHPMLPRDATWAGILLIVIVGGFFLPAAVIGPIAVALAPEEEPEPPPHHEPAHGHH